MWDASPDADYQGQEIFPTLDKGALRKSFKLPEKLKKEIEREFPSDFALQQVHFARAILREETRGMSKGKLIEYYRRKASELARLKVPS